VKIRRATDADAAPLTHVIIAAYAPYQHLDLPPVDEGVAEDIIRHYVWVAEIKGFLRGGIVLRLDGQAHIANLAVDPAMAGRGIGRMLIETACAAAKRDGFDTIELATHRGMTGTQVFYRKLGWELVGREGERVYLSKQLI
jgi:ribosomal protein S18 acetylase RimI-like enzyme